MLNSSFIQSNIPNLETQKRLLRDRFEVEKANGYIFELIPTKREPNTVKFANKLTLEDREYSLEELNNIVFALNKGLIDGIIREADIRNAKTIKLSYGLESLAISWGAEIPESLGHVLFKPVSKHFNYLTEKDEISPADLICIILVDFSS